MLVFLSTFNLTASTVAVYQSASTVTISTGLRFLCQLHGGFNLWGGVFRKQSGVCSLLQPMLISVKQAQYIDTVTEVLWNLFFAWLQFQLIASPLQMHENRTKPQPSAILDFRVYGHVTRPWRCHCSHTDWKFGALKSNAIWNTNIADIATLLRRCRSLIV